VAEGAVLSLDELKPSGQLSAMGCVGVMPFDLRLCLLDPTCWYLRELRARMIDNQRRGSIGKDVGGLKEKAKNEGNSNGCPFHHQSIPFSMNVRSYQNRQNAKRFFLFSAACRHAG
jgi:hypothetical protein